MNEPQRLNLINAMMLLEICQDLCSGAIQAEDCIATGEDMLEAAHNLIESSLYEDDVSLGAKHMVVKVHANAAIKDAMRNSK